MGPRRRRRRLRRGARRRAARRPRLRHRSAPGGRARPAEPPRPRPPAGRQPWLVLAGFNWDYRANLRSSGRLEELLKGGDGTGTQARALWERFPYQLGKVVGGGSAVNGAIALRGLPRDFAAWAARGNTDWSWDKVLPFYRAVENDADYPDRPPHGDSGPLPIRRTPRERVHPWTPPSGRSATARASPTSRPQLRGGGRHRTDPRQHGRRRAHRRRHRVPLRGPRPAPPPRPSRRTGHPGAVRPEGPRPCRRRGDRTGRAARHRPGPARGPRRRGRRHPRDPPALRRRRRGPARRARHRPGRRPARRGPRPGRPPLRRHLVTAGRRRVRPDCPGGRWPPG